MELSSPKVKKFQEGPILAQKILKTTFFLFSYISGNGAF